MDVAFIFILNPLLLNEGANSFSGTGLGITGFPLLVILVDISLLWVGVVVRVCLGTCFIFPLGILNRN